MAGLLDVALDWAARGMFVFPLRPGSKEPAGSLVPRGHLDATRDPARIRAWWRRLPGANVGIATQPSGLYVVDVDAGEGKVGAAVWAGLVAGQGVPDTFSVSTVSGGRHLYFRSSDLLRSTRGKLGKNVDTRGNGYVVAPGSVVGGVEYKVEDDAPIAALPRWIAQAVAGRSAGASRSGSSTHRVSVLPMLVRRQALARDRIERGVLKRVALLLAGVRGNDWYNDARVQQLAAGLARVVSDGQAATARVTAAYLTEQMRDLDVPDVAEVVPDLSDNGLRPGVSLAEEMERVAVTYRWAVSEGMTADAAQDRAADRARLLVDADLGLAMRDAAAEVIRRAPAAVSGFRRVVHPELSRGGVCGLCMAAADRVYSREDLLPLHTRCRCEVVPIVGDADPGRSLNDEALAELYEAAGSTSARDLVKVRYRVDEHGELGPVLSDERHEFRGPVKPPDSGSRVVVNPDPEKTLAITATHLEWLRGQAAGGRDVASAIEYHEDLIEKLRAQIAQKAAA